jgi:ParB-like chromosome segregation protein Spo0J
VAEWENRIVGHGEESPDQLVANPRNWRIHPHRQQNVLEGAIKDVGFLRSVTVNRRTGYVLDGHLRVAMAISSGQESIPVEYVDLSEAEEAEALATLDPISGMAVADEQQFSALMEDIESSDENVAQMLSELAAEQSTITGVENVEGQRGSVQDRMENEYLSTDLRQIVLIMESAEFEWAVDTLRRLRGGLQVETNAEALLALLRQWDESA